MRGYIDTYRRQNIISDKGAAIIYEVISLSIHKGYLRSDIKFDTEFDKSKIHTPFVLEWNEENDIIRLLGIMCNTENTADQNSRCLAAHLILNLEQGWVGLDEEWSHCIHQSSYNQNLFQNAFSCTQVFDDRISPDKIVHLVKDKNFRKEIFDILKIGKIKAKVPDFE